MTNFSSLLPPYRMKEKITEALQGNEVPTPLEISQFSRNYKMSNNLEGNMIFDSTGYMPKEVMLEMTLKAFGYDLDVLEVWVTATQVVIFFRIGQTICQNDIF